MIAWTDYPITELGDAEGQKAPVREVTVLSFDGDKYCRVVVQGIETEIKAGYLYQKKGRYGKVSQVTIQQLGSLA